MKQESTAPAAEVFRQNMTWYEILAVFDTYRKREEKSLATIASLLAALEGHGCEIERNDCPPCIDERPAKAHWCDTCLAIDEARP